MQAGSQVLRHRRYLVARQSGCGVKGVTDLATDGPSMVPIGHSWEGKPMAQMTHVKFLERGGSWTEFCRNFGQLPARGAYFISLSAKVVDMSGGLTRAIAIKPKGPGIGG